MKRFFLSGVAIAACFGLATTASAQYGSNHQYSSYGYGYQEAEQEAVNKTKEVIERAEQALSSPSDAPVAAPTMIPQPGVPQPGVPSGQACPPGGQVYGSGYGNSYGGGYGNSYGGGYGNSYGGGYQQGTYGNSYGNSYGGYQQGTGVYQQDAGAAGSGSRNGLGVGGAAGSGSRNGLDVGGAAGSGSRNGLDVAPGYNPGGIVNGGGVVNGGIVNGGVVNGGVVNGGVVNGGVVNGGVVNGGVVNGGGFANGGGVVYDGGNYLNSGNYGGGYIDGGYVGGGYIDSGFSGGAITGGGIGAGNLVQSNDRNITFAVRGLVFERDYEDDRGLGSDGFGKYLFTTDADEDFFGGFETILGVRNASGSGWEASYWGLFPDQADVNFADPPLFSAFDRASRVDLNGFDYLDILNTSSSWRLYRQTEIHNFEWHALRNGGTARGLFGGTTNLEWLAGVRWLKFSEDIRFAANNFTGNGYPQLSIFDLDVENNLVGLQLGARMERCFGKRTSLALGTKFGVYNNDIYTRQSIRDGAGTFATVPSGPVDYNFTSRKDELATLGELDLGLNYQFSNSLRANFGYRAIGVTSVALAADQIPFNFQDTQEIQRVKSNGSLLLHGVYFGLEKCF